MDKFELIVNHYVRNWKTEPQFYLFDRGPVEKVSLNFRVLEFPPTATRNMWTYATCGLSDAGDIHRAIELHLFSSRKDDTIIELLTMVAYYHQNSSQLDLNHTINFGRAWQQDSLCKFGFISLPYLDGPSLEILNGTPDTKFYWLIPVTEEEVSFKKQYGAQELEILFDGGFNYLDPDRLSVI